MAAVPLSTQERECAWLGAEMSTNEIAERLGISPRRVKSQLDSARHKLGVRTKRQLPGALRRAQRGEEVG
jgi:DNA-binding CsgD family transcriptional regulator